MKRYINIFIFFLSVNIMLMSVIQTGGKAAYSDGSVGVLKDESSLYNISKIDEIVPSVITAPITVRLLLSDAKTVINIPIDEYVAGVLTGEMYSTAHTEALKAVAVAARTYTLYMCNASKNKKYDVVADASLSQAYISKSDAYEIWNEDGINKYEIMKKAVEETKSEVITYDGELICAMYHASSYPKTENSENVFLTSLPYLVGQDSIETIDNTYKKTITFTIEDFNELLSRESFPRVTENGLSIEIKKNDNLRCKYLYIKDKEKSFSVDGRIVRSLLGLPSTSFDVTVEPDKVVFDVYGFGHGVGLSQNGADIMAKKGADYREILSAYYKGTEIYETVT